MTSVNIDGLAVAAYTVPTEGGPESDGTLVWDSTTMHVEWFHDHARIERMFFVGLPELADGALRPDRSRPGHGLELRRDHVAGYRA